MNERARCSGGCVSRNEIKRVAEESTSGSEDGQRTHRGDKQAKPSPINFASR
jgi:hypothetical protein